MRIYNLQLFKITDKSYNDLLKILYFHMYETSNNRELIYFFNYTHSNPSLLLLRESYERTQ